ncbi:hypothetical protein FHS82_003074 [Pseudochelatococcus lubricantis]|uniref:HNH nuclease domain-containing protein n=1 Tax=Pseudochelatococcus lubricantis TaxID=1538102 RepID=A0ABX0V3V8_9HYPH|nr:HNH endonuclease signature motif containing protein [Pseudochelatococcus lubricantis]NIJ59219.1 hypothetical protein [Pseudochelatococcus lubricantis]
MTFALDAFNAPGTAVALVQRSHVKNRRMRLRSCPDCGRIDEVRADNLAPRCRRCAGRPMLEMGRELKSAGRNRETCQHCRIDFPAPPSSRQKFCSRACRVAARSTERTCTTCGTEFRIARSILSGRSNSCGRFCSRPCYERHLCRTPRIRGRGSRWVAVRREALRLTPFCACCGGRKHLQVHHIIPFRLTQDNSQTNLIPLCRVCHKRVETVFHNIEAAAPPIPLTKLVLFCSIHAMRTVTLHKLKALKSDASHRAAA